MLFRIGQDWVVEVQTLCEVCILFDGVDARGEVGDIEITNQFTALTERFAFLRSATGKSFGVPSDDERLLSFELFRRISFSVTANKFEVRDLVTD